MKKNIWVVCNNKKELYDIQHCIDDGGGMKAIIVPSIEAVKRNIERCDSQNGFMIKPSLILGDADMGLDMLKECVDYIQEIPAYAGVPVLLMCRERTPELDIECYGLGAMIVLQKPISELDIVRIERASWQYEMTCNYEKILQKQASVIEATKEIKELNDKLEARNKILQQVFGKYFSEDIVNVILDQPGGDALGGEKINVSILMADLRGFTTLSDKLEADAVVDIIDNFLAEMTKIIKEYKGVVIEFIGDEVLAIFGAPTPLECSEGNAIAAAITMQNKMRSINEYNRSKDYPEIGMGIGINKGEVFIGNIGSEYLMRYNVIGTNVNLCSRIEGYSSKGQILVSEAAVNNIKDILTIKNRYYIDPKGFSGDIPIVEVTGIGGEYGRIQEMIKYV